MNAGKAFRAGVVVGAVMTLLAALARALGMQINTEMMLGTMFGGPPSMGKWFLGLAMRLTISGLIALGYATGFEYVTRRASAGIGLGFSLVHALIAGLLLAMIPALHPLIPEEMPAPGAFMANMGALYVAAFMIEHMIYGGIVGAMYQPVSAPVVGSRVAPKRRFA